MVKKIAFIFSFLLLFLKFASSAYAQCPACLVTIGGSVLLSRYLGIDDLIIGIWIGGFIVSFGLWTAKFIKKNYIKGQKWVITAVLWITTVWSLKLAKFIGNPTCKIHGHDKLLTGIEVGTVVFLLAYEVDLLLRKYNKKDPGKAMFPYQKVILPVVLLLIATLIGAKVCQIKL